MRQFFYFMVCFVFLLGACTRSLSTEEKAQVLALQTELEATKKEVAASEVQNAQYSGGLAKALIVVRLEILKTNEALIKQRIQSIESGAKMTITTIGTKPDDERAKQLAAELTKQEILLSEADAKASPHSGGLVGAMAMVGVATERNTLAMLRQQYLIAKYGLGMSPPMPAQPNSSEQIAKATFPAVAGPASAGASSRDLREQILDVTLLRKQYLNQDYQEFVSLDITFNAKGLDKPTRAIKGVLGFTDLFGEQKLGLNWTIEKPMLPGETYTEKGSGFKYNQFMDAHQWVQNTARENMKLTFRVVSILYEDGTTRTFD